MTRWLGTLCICALLLSTVGPVAAQQPGHPSPPPGMGIGGAWPPGPGGMG